MRSVCVCVCVCLSVCLSASELLSGTAGPIFTECLYPVCPWLGPPLAALRCYVFPVMWMTSHFAAMGRMAYINTGAQFDVHECVVTLFCVRQEWIICSRFSAATERTFSSSWCCRWTKSTHGHQTEPKRDMKTACIETWQDTCLETTSSPLCSTHTVYNVLCSVFATVCKVWLTTVFRPNRPGTRKVWAIVISRPPSVRSSVTEVKSVKRGSFTVLVVIPVP